MRAVQQARAASEIAQRGNLRETSFAELLVALLDLQKRGTLRVVDDHGQVLALVRFDGGLPVAARVPRLEANLIQSLIPLCACADGDYTFHDNRDDVGSGEGMVSGRVDPLALIAAVFRGPVREDAVSELIGSIGPQLLKLHPRVRLERYRFTQQEQQVVELLLRGPLSLGELESYFPGRVVRRVVYVLKVTRGVSLVSPTRRAVSGTVEHTAPLPATPVVEEREDATARVALATQQLMAAQEQGPQARRVSSPPPLPSRPPTEAARDGRYHVRDPQAGASDRPLLVFENAELSPVLMLWAKEIRERASQIKRQDHYQALGVQSDCVENDLHAAFATVSSRLSPDGLPEELAPLRPRAARILERLTVAYQTLLDPNKRALYDEERKHGPQTLTHNAQHNRLQAAELHQREAERLLRLSDYPAALTEAHKALRWERSARNEALFAWLLYLRSGGATATRTHAAQHLLNALRREPQSVEAHYYHAMFCKSTGEAEQALAAFRRVLKLKPQHPEAARELRVLEARHRPRSSSGLLQRLFSRPPAKAEND